ncbi:hypothetical protein P8452_57611 [Trifolium repens]|nr:hypothetical protein P8452_57611 [Trifolium repens]
MLLYSYQISENFRRSLQESVYYFAYWFETPIAIVKVVRCNNNYFARGTVGEGNRSMRSTLIALRYSHNFIHQSSPRFNSIRLLAELKEGKK